MSANNVKGANLLAEGSNLAGNLQNYPVTPALSISQMTSVAKGGIGDPKALGKLRSRTISLRGAGTGRRA